MRIILWTLILVLILISSWLHYPWAQILSWLNNSNFIIADRLSIVVSITTSLFLVFIVEWLRGSEIKFYTNEVSAPFEKQDRKLLKIGIKAEAHIPSSLLALLKFPVNIHTNSSLTIESDQIPKHSYRAKWDQAPEPVEYPHSENENIVLTGKYSEDNKKFQDIKLEGKLEKTTSEYSKLEMLPLAMQTENILPGDCAEASIFAKHEGETFFWVFDPEYYFKHYHNIENKNKCKGFKIFIKAIFKSSLGKWESYFCIFNQGRNLENFKIEAISKSAYKIKKSNFEFK